MRPLTTVFTVLVLTASTLQSGGTATAGPVRAAGSLCSFTAHAWDPDPSGTNVRAEPNASAPILAVLPQEVGEEEAAFSPEFDVVGFSKGWFLIENVAVDQYGDGPARVIFDGPGWISARLVAFTINDASVRSAPDESADVVAELLGGDWGPESVIVQAVHDCHGPFAEVTLETPDGDNYRGWVTGLCGNQVTTCP